MSLPLVGAQDHKRAFDGDTGPNTGGMGAYSPAPVMTPPCSSARWTRSSCRRCAALAARGTPFKGVLFAGLMIDAKGPQADRIQCAASAIPRRRC